MTADAAPQANRLRRFVEVMYTAEGITHAKLVGRFGLAPNDAAVDVEHVLVNKTLAEYNGMSSAWRN